MMSAAAAAGQGGAAAAAGAQASEADIPAEALQHVFETLGAYDLAMASGVCRFWRGAAKKVSVLQAKAKIAAYIEQRPAAKTALEGVLGKINIGEISGALQIEWAIAEAVEPHIRLSSDCVVACIAHLKFAQVVGGLISVGMAFELQCEGGYFARARAHIDKFLGVDRDQKLNELSDALASKGRIDEALALPLLSPDRARMNLIRQMCEREGVDIDRLIPLAEGLTEPIHLYIAYSSICRLLSRHGEFDRALQTSERVIDEKDRGNIHSWICMEMCAAKEFDRALDVYKALDSTHVDTEAASEMRLHLEPDHPLVALLPSEFRDSNGCSDEDGSDYDFSDESEAFGCSDEDRSDYVRVKL